MLRDLIRVAALMLIAGAAGAQLPPPPSEDPPPPPPPPPPLLPATKEQCFNDGWRAFVVFKNQGDCVSFVATKGKNPPGKPAGKGS